jgi:hypothetical protein
MGGSIMSHEADDEQNRIELPDSGESTGTMYLPIDAHRRNTDGLSRIEILLFDDEMRSIQNENYRKAGVISTVDILNSVAEVAKRVKAINLARSRPKRGPVPLSPEEYAEYAESIIKEWRESRNNGHTQEEFAGYKGWQSRTPLTNAIKWYRSKYSAKSV